MVLPFLPSTLPIILMMILITPQLRCFYFFLYVYYYFLLLYFFYFYNFLPSLLCSHLSHFRGLLLLQQSILKQTTSLFQPLAGHYFLHIQSPMGRRFSKNWYKLYPWLEYEITKDAAFLFHLYSLFKQCPPAGKMDSQLRGGFNTWKKATIAFSKHALSQLNHAPNTRLEFR